MTKTVEEVVNETIAAAAKLKGISLDEFKEKHNGKREVVRARHLVAHILSKLFDQPNEERVMGWLDCSVGFVRIANRLAYDLDADGESFRDDLVKMGHEPVKLSQKKKELDVPKEIIDPEELLFKIASEVYKLDRAVLLKKNPGINVTRARRVMVGIGVEFFGMSDDAIVDMLGYSKDSIARITEATSDSYKYEAAFRREVNDLCRRYGIEKTSS